MHYTPEQVGRMSLYQFAACVDGLNAANSSPEIKAPTDEEFAAAKAAHGDD